MAPPYSDPIRFQQHDIVANKAERLTFSTQMTLYIFLQDKFEHTKVIIRSR
jgi:hypothetical protein